MRSQRKKLNVPTVARIAGAVSGGPPTFIKGSGKKNLARMNPLGAPPENSSRKNRSHTRQVLKNYLKSKLNGNLLDLSYLSKAQQLSDVTCNFNAKSFVDVLFDIIGEDLPPIESLNLEGNGISTLATFRLSAQEHDQLGFIRNLNISNNQIHSFKELDNLRPFKLAEVIMKGNPIAANKQYAKQVVTKLPTVEMVDLTNVASIRTQLKPRLPPVTATYLFRGGGTKDLLYKFCTAYFTALDEQKFDTDLLEAYSPDCLFTLTTDHALGIGYGARADAITRNLREQGHNLLHLRNETAPAKTVCKGRLACINALREKVLGGMRTKHDFASFEVDAVQLAPSLETPVVSAVVHGKATFTVQLAAAAGSKECSFVRCFDRTFILVAPQQDSKWPCLIVNDMLHLRPLRDSSVLKPLVDTSVPPNLETARRTALAKLMASTTRLTEEYAGMCLEAADWDLAKAQTLFEERRECLPQEAWQK
eukprot:TRINITY_DN21158_c1_g1_i1.p1 TRINITY_DN21158_c1_g1~~TRINITY_DN21158_c1_g1_i1.p1  ORF type:complete len:478 (+),score=134.82 TRINITY_DN21158_c1_g1_i1:66-1499(+)